jgi:3,4-dihydroxy-2-butanone 4-phosphate synthase
MKFNTIEEAIEDIKLGKCVIVVDDEDWGNINHFLKPYDSSLAN